jgi:hypothetical protein
MATEAVLLLRTFYEQGNPNGKIIFTILLSIFCIVALVLISNRFGSGTHKGLVVHLFKILFLHFQFNVFISLQLQNLTGL